MAINWRSQQARLAWYSLASFPGPIYESRGPYPLLAHAPGLYGNPQKNTGYLCHRNCYHGDPAHAQAVCTRPSPLVYGAWEQG